MKHLSLLSVRSCTALAAVALLALSGGCSCAQPGTNGPHPAPATADGKDKPANHPVTLNGPHQ